MKPPQPARKPTSSSTPHRHRHFEKALVLEEFGLPRDHENYSPIRPRRRATIISAGCSRRCGILPVGRAARRDFWLREGARGRDEIRRGLMGDPFSGTAGAESIMDTDTGTLAVIAQANEKLMAFDR